MKCFVVIAAVAVLAAASPVMAQSGWTAEFSGGTATPVDDIGSRLSSGWDVDLAAGYQFNRWVSVLGDFGFAGMAVPDSVLQEFNAPDGHGRIVTLMVNPRVGFALTKRFHGFVTGGVGWIHRAVDLTAPTLQYIDSYDPFYGDYLGPQAIQSDQVLSSVTRDAFGGDFGGGVDLPLESIGADLIVGVRYYRGPTSPRVTAMVPVTFGIRWVSK
jgi:opacity protein-like surface antigen